MKLTTSKTGKDEDMRTRNLKIQESENLKTGTDYLYEEPFGLDDLGLQYYYFLLDELESLDILCNLDKSMIEIASDCLSKMYYLSERINREGVLLKYYDRNGKVIVKPHPAIKLREDYIKRYTAVSNSLGLDPVSRSNLAAKRVDAGDQDDPLLKLLNESDE